MESDPRICCCRLHAGTNACPDCPIHGDEPEKLLLTVTEVSYYIVAYIDNNSHLQALGILTATQVWEKVEAQLSGALADPVIVAPIEIPSSQKKWFDVCHMNFGIPLYFERN